MNILEARRRTLGKGVYKKTVEGNPAIALGSLARMYPGITMQGWTEQAQYDGKNLFDGIFTVDTVLDSNGETVPYSGRSTTDFIKVKQSTDYTGFTRYLRACYYDAGKVIISYDDDTVTRQTPEGCEYVRFCFINGSNVMFNEGSTALPYEPYTGGQPSPNPDYPQEITSAGKYDEGTGKYQYEVKLTGKNLIPKYSEYSDWMTGSYKYIPVSGFTIGETYTFSQSVVPELGTGFYVALGTFAGNVNIGKNYWLYHSKSQNLCEKSITFVATQETYYLNVSGFSSTNMSRFLSLFPDLMVELGTERTEYQPYKNQTVTLTSDRPLTKWDRLEKRNGQWGWVYKSAEVVLDGSEDWSYYSSYEGFSLVGVFDNPRLRSEGYSENFICETGSYNLGRYALLWLGVNNTNIYAVKIPQYNAELPDRGVSDWKTWLSENPITILTYADEETFVPLSSSEQEQMNALYTFRPTTVLSNDCDCNMILTYKTKKSLEVTT